MISQKKRPSRPRIPKLILGDAALDLLTRDAHVQRATAWIASAVLFYAAGAPPRILGAWICGVLPIALAVTAVQALRQDVGRARDRFEERFWRDLEVAAVLFGGAAAIHLPAIWWNSSIPPLLGRALLLAAYAVLLLAAETQPHREGFWRSESLERRLSWLTVGLLGFGLFGYFAVIPALVGGRLADSAGPSAFIFTVLTALVGLRFLALGFAADNHEFRWRTVYRALALGAFGLTGFHGLGAGGGSIPSLVQLLPAAAGFWLWIVAARLRSYPFPAEWKPRRPDREPAADPVEESRLGLDFRTLLLALLVPMLHFLGTDAGLLEPAYREVREIWMLAWTLGLGVSAFAQQNLSGGRLLAILTEQRRIQRTLAAGERRMQMVEERKETDEALYYSREKYAKAFRAGPYPMATLNLEDGRILEANGEFLAMLGLEIADLATVRFGGLLSEDGHGKLRDILRTGSVRDLELEVTDRRGRKRRISLSAEPIAADRHLVICTDLSRLEDLAERADFQQGLLDQCAAPVLAVDGEGRLLHGNPAVSAVFPDKFTRLEELFEPGPELTAAELAAREGRNFMGRLKVRAGDGEKTAVDCWWMPLERNAGGRTDRLVVIVGKTPDEGS